MLFNNRSLYFNRFTFFSSPTKQETSEINKPTNEMPRPKDTELPLEAEIQAIPKRDIETPNSDKRIITPPCVKILLPLSC